MKRIFLTILAVSLFVAANAQKFPGLAETPPMGWNSWNIYACDINENLIKEVAKAMVDRGLRDAGYEYVVIDDCWHGVRDSLGFIQCDPVKFPSGIKALADYIHSLGLKFGIYSDAGWKTCGGRPGSRGYEFQDAMQYAKWGVDYLKYDWCSTDGLNAVGAYQTMRDALYKAGRPIVFSMCEWGQSKPWLWAKDTGHLWRTTGDICNKWEGNITYGTWTAWSAMTILDMQDGLREYAGPGHWNDPDMMEVGNGLSVSENRAHFSMWCMIAAPLIAGTNIQKASDETIAILTNEEAISINQDKLGVQGFKFSKKDSLEIWYKPLADNEWAVCFLNRDSLSKSIDYSWVEQNVIDGFAKRVTNFPFITYSVRDVWAHKELGNTKINLKAQLPPHDVLMLRLKPVKK
ncbi:MAG TPA: glycoside hydrolase family 27 protein [Prolixibacteraceae bacterium]|nr:glycoside hydrolase family 27 protein [Prolixibacteraceae bacterium]HPS11968.1 glycoside hydrolase family 27 protein [Prolixibacteraceae bacterium]